MKQKLNQINLLFKDARVWLWLLAANTLAACSPSLVATSPSGFAMHTDPSDFDSEDVILSSISHTGVVYRVRTVENDPKASLEFWKERLKLHLENSGYIFKKSFSIKATNLLGERLEFHAPTRETDYYFSVSLFMHMDSIVLVEIAGELKSFGPLRQALSEAIGKIRAI